MIENDQEVSAGLSAKVILGTGNFGGIGSSPELYGFGENREQAWDILEAAKNLGVDKFDTANSYGGGASEEYLGEWLSNQEASYRSTIQLHSKVGNPAAATCNQFALSTQEIDFHLSHSLRRLRTSYLDLYYIHQPDPFTPIQETVDCLFKNVRLGRINKIGLSNVNFKYVKRFLSCLSPQEAKCVYGVQNEFNYLVQNDAEELIPFLKKIGIKYIAFSPLAGGLLTGKYELDVDFPEQSRLALRSEPYRKLLTKEVFLKIDSMKQSALSGHRSSSEEAIQFLINNSEIDFIVIGPRRREHFESLGFKFERNK